MQNPTLAKTLEAVAANGSSALYGPGSIAQSIVDTVTAFGGIMTLEDLQRYDVRVVEPLQAEFNGKYRISRNFQGIYISRISLVRAQFVKCKVLKYFTSIRKIWSPAAILEIKILEMENESPFVKYTTIENNHLYGTMEKD